MPNKDPDKRRAWKRAYYAREGYDEAKSYAHHIKRYGLTPDDYGRMLRAQDGKCAICRRPPSRNRLHIDHDHRTGKVRELLCAACNTQLSTVEDDAKLARLHAYLAKHRST